MNDASNKPAVSTDEKKVPTAPQDPWRPFDTLRRQVDRLFDAVSYTHLTLPTIYSV